jgi:hypothetical protein
MAPQKAGLVLKSTEPDYQDEEVHLGSESFVRLDVTDRATRGRK